VLSQLTNDGNTTLLSAVVDSLPGSSGKRNAGHSWLITDQKLPITLPPANTLAKSLTFTLPATSFTLPLANTVFQTGKISTLVHLPATAQEIKVPAYIDALPEDQRPNKVDVFARLTTDKPSPDQGEMLLAPGTRIHRVLSGGGGWGSKTGLLSLDPQGESEVESFAQEFEARFSGEDDSTSPRSGAVQVGEWVQFFVGGENSPDIEEKGIRLGCVSKVQEIEDDTSGMDGEQKELEGLFGGAAEEGGVDITVAGKRRRMDVPGGVVVVDV